MILGKLPSSQKFITSVSSSGIRSFGLRRIAYSGIISQHENYGLVSDQLKRKAQDELTACIYASLSHRKGSLFAVDAFRYGLETKVSPDASSGDTHIRCEVSALADPTPPTIDLSTFAFKPLDMSLNSPSGSVNCAAFDDPSTSNRLLAFPAHHLPPRVAKQFVGVLLGTNPDHPLILQRYVALSGYKHPDVLVSYFGIHTVGLFTIILLPYYVCGIEVRPLLRLISDFCGPIEQFQVHPHQSSFGEFCFALKDNIKLASTESTVATPVATTVPAPTPVVVVRLSRSQLLDALRASITE